MYTDKQKYAMTSLLALLEREYAWEKEQYKVDKRIANLLSDLGFVIADQDNSGDPLHQRLLK